MTALLLTAIVLGSTIGVMSPRAGDALQEGVDPLILLLIGALVFAVRVDALPSLRRAPRTALIAIGLNFLIVPLIAVPLTLILVPDDALRLGVLIYCLAPCTDWFLGFTRLAGGDMATGAALIPVQMLLQLALYPVWLMVFAGEQVGSVFGEAGESLLLWFAAPVGLAIALRILLRFAARSSLRRRLTPVPAPTRRTRPRHDHHLGAKRSGDARRDAGGLPGSPRRRRGHRSGHADRVPAPDSCHTSAPTTRSRG
ncbi:arsenic resistance protein [Microbacterium amylolyticum]|nr:hypothetical protein [Microbacterium amylolyticum]